MKLESTKLLLLQIIQVNAYYYFLTKIVPVIPVPKLYKRRAKYQTLQNKNRPMLTSVLNICPDKTKEFVHRDIKTKKLLCLGTQSSTSKVTQKNCKGSSMCKFYVSM